MAAFGGMYLTEGLPQGFAGVALTLEFKRRGMDAAAIGAFSGTILLPWSWKFLIGPLVDNLHIRRFGARKQWIIMAQTGILLMVALALTNMPTFTDGGAVGLGLFTALMVTMNIFAATQDVAIDALACQVLKPDERGLANGIMFGSAQAGNAIGGSGVIALKGLTGNFELSSLLVPLLLILILTGIIAFVCEHSAAQEMAEGELPAPDPGDQGFKAAKDQIVNYVIIAGKSMFGSRNGLLGLAMALLPCGGMALSMVVTTIISPTLGMTDKEIATLNLLSTLIWVPCCLSGGWLSDRFGRKQTLSLFAFCSALPGLWMGWQFHQAGWAHPPPGVDGVWPRADELITLWWIASFAFSVFNGLMFGIRTAFFMDIVNPKIAATHFTALMAMTNLVISYTWFWQGRAISTTSWDWTLWQILLADSLFGLVFILIIPFVKIGKHDKGWILN